ncbi:MAG: hypothetical protein WDO19_03435 [Bacteroidota bacterium]
MIIYATIHKDLKEEVYQFLLIFLVRLSNLSLNTQATIDWNNRWGFRLGFPIGYV